MKFGRSHASDIDEFGVTTLIAFELVREPRNGMQWLVGIPDQVKQPHEIVALQIVRAVVVRKSGFEQADLGERIYRRRRIRLFAIGRERDVVVVPVVMDDVIGCTNILCGGAVA